MVACGHPSPQRAERDSTVYIPLIMTLRLLEGQGPPQSAGKW